MFEREVIVSSLKKNSVDLEKLIEELEERPRFDGIDLNYWKETLKRIESGLRKIRRIEANMEPVTDRYGASFANSVW